MSVQEEVRETIERFFEAMNTKNLALMKKLIPRHETTVHVGTGHGEIWKGWQVLHNASKQQFEKLEYYDATIRDLTINVAKSQDIAWYFLLLDAEIKSNGSITSWEGARFSGVVQKRSNRWTLEQTHVSLPE